MDSGGHANAVRWSLVTSTATVRWRRVALLAVSLVAVFNFHSAAAEADLPVRARAALERATAYWRSIATEGGYLWRYSLDLKQRAGEVGATATQIWVQPPGTPSMGMAYLRAYEATKDARYLDAARGAAHALAVGQLESGGWDYVVEFEPVKSKGWYRRADKGKITEAEAAKRKNISTYDDDTTQSALRFLLAFVDATKGSTDPRDAEIRTALDHGLKKLLEAQYPIGAWPQRWNGKAHDPVNFPFKQATLPKDHPREQPKTGYYAHYTFNDNSHHDLITTLLEAHQLTSRREYLEAAKRGGDFILRAQLPEPQPAWAQQYNADMEPAWARAFEPPAVTGGESVGAMRTLVELYVQTGEEKFLKPIPAALAWFKRSEIAPNRWARYYELHTNKQLFGDRDGKIHYTLAEISEERQHGYGWSGDYGLSGFIRQYERVKQDGREKELTRRAPKAPTDKAKAERAKSLAPKVAEIIAALDTQGRWVSKGDIKKRDWEFSDRVETSVFIQNVETLANYLEAAGP